MFELAHLLNTNNAHLYMMNKNSLNFTQCDDRTHARFARLIFSTPVLRRRGGGGTYIFEMIYHPVIHSRTISHNVLWQSKTNRKRIKKQIFKMNYLWMSFVVVVVVCVWRGTKKKTPPLASQIIKSRSHHTALASHQRFIV